MAQARTHDSQQSGIILQKKSYGDDDEILTVLFQDGLVARLFAPKSKKSKKRFGNVLDLFTELEFFYVPKDDGLWRLHQVQSTERSLKKGQDQLEIYGFYHFLSELITDLVADFDQHTELFFLWRDLNALLLQNSLSLALMNQTLIKVLTFLGYQPQLDQCLVCGGREHQKPVLFDSIRGGVRCCFRLVSQSDSYDVLPWQALMSLESAPAIEQAGWEKVFLKQLIRFTESIRQKQSLSGQFLMTVV